MTLLALIAAPVIVAWYFCDPVADTPPLTYWERWEFPDRWIATQPHGKSVCKEIIIEFTTDANRTYWIECSALHEPMPWEVGLTNVVFHQWRQCSPLIAGTGGIVAWRGGSPWDRTYFRVGMAP